MSAALPAWVYQLLDGLYDYDYLHPQLYAQYAGSNDYQKADCPCHLLKLVPEQVKRDMQMFMAGARSAAEERGMAVEQMVCTCIAGDGKPHPGHDVEEPN